MIVDPSRVDPRENSTVPGANWIWRPSNRQIRPATLREPWVRLYGIMDINGGVLLWTVLLFELCCVVVGQFDSYAGVDYHSKVGIHKYETEGLTPIWQYKIIGESYASLSELSAVGKFSLRRLCGLASSRNLYTVRMARATGNGAGNGVCWRHLRLTWGPQPIGWEVQSRRSVPILVWFVNNLQQYASDMSFSRNSSTDQIRHFRRPSSTLQM